MHPYCLLSPIAIATLSFGWARVVFMGVRDTADDEIRWQENDFREDRVREERDSQGYQYLLEKEHQCLNAQLFYL